MSTYTKISDFAAKDALLTGNPSKIVKGVEIGAEFDSIAAADASNVKGPTSAVTDNAVVRWDTTTGRLAQGSGVTISDVDVVTASGFSGPHNGTVGATTPATGAFTTLSASGGTQSTGVYAYKVGAATGNYYHFDTGSGGQYMGLSAANTLDVVVGGVNTARITNTGMQITGALSATGNVTIEKSTPILRIKATADTEQSLIHFADTTSNFPGVIGYDHSNNTMVFYTDLLERMRIDSAGNIGLAVTPSAWAGNSKTLTISNAVAGRRNNGASIFGHNFYESVADTFTYTQTGVAARMEIPTAGGFTWYTAPSGTAGNAITFTQAMTLDASGRLLVPNGTVVAPVAFASLPAAPVAGQRAMINNSVAAPAFLSTAAGGGSTTVPVFYNGTAWLVG